MCHLGQEEAVSSSNLCLVPPAFRTIPRRQWYIPSYYLKRDTFRFTTRVTMALNKELSSFSADFAQSVPPPVASLITSAIENAVQSFDPAKAAKVGSEFPDF
jgi:hypothetical protein